MLLLPELEFSGSDGRMHGDMRVIDGRPQPQRHVSPRNTSSRGGQAPEPAQPGPKEQIPFDGEAHALAGLWQERQLAGDLFFHHPQIAGCCLPVFLFQFDPQEPPTESQSLPSRGSDPRERIEHQLADI